MANEGFRFTESNQGGTAKHKLSPLNRARVFCFVCLKQLKGGVSVENDLCDCQLSLCLLEVFPTDLTEQDPSTKRTWQRRP